MAAHNIPALSLPAHSSHDEDDDDDPFDPLSTAQNLETSYYTEGYALGRSDGARAGRVEGRVFGLEKGFDKFFAMGRLGGRAAVWGARLDEGEAKMAPLRQHPRLAGHVMTLHALAEAASLETRNTEDGVADFDDRFRRAEAKAKIIERVVLEPLDEDEVEEEAGRVEEKEGDCQEAEAETETKEDFAVEVTMGHVEERLRKERENERDNKTPVTTLSSNSSSSSSSTKKPPVLLKAPKRAGVKVAGGGSRPRAGEKNMEDFGINEARALGRLP